MASQVDKPLLGGKVAVLLFAVTLVSFVVESQLTQYVQTTLDYRHPFFLFYVVHSTFALMLPLHLALLRLRDRSISVRSLWDTLLMTLHRHMSGDPSRARGDVPFPWSRFLRFTVILTIGATTPGLLWFAAVSLASLSDVTALWNANAFFAYLFAVKIFKMSWESRKLAAVLLATLGVLLDVYGGSAVSDTGSSSVLSVSNAYLKPSAPLIGELLTLVASILYGLYQVLYKKYAAIPNDLAGGDHFSPLGYEPITDPDLAPPSPQLLRSNAAEHPSVLPFGLYPNLLTSAIGVCTAALLWIPLLFLNYTGAEEISLPRDPPTVASIAGIALSGMMFNGGFMILLGVWGPIVVSVGNLLTIVLVFISDLVFGNGAESMTFWSLLGSGTIVVAFGILAFDMMKPSGPV